MKIKHSFSGKDEKKLLNAIATSFGKRSIASFFLIVGIFFAITGIILIKEDPANSTISIAIGSLAVFGSIFVILKINGLRSIVKKSIPDESLHMEWDIRDDGISFLNDSLFSKWSSIKKAFLCDAGLFLVSDQDSIWMPLEIYSKEDIKEKLTAMLSANQVQIKKGRMKQN